jgi:hypothetical protein
LTKKQGVLATKNQVPAFNGKSGAKPLGRSSSLYHLIVKANNGLKDSFVSRFRSLLIFKELAQLAFKP